MSVRWIAHDQDERTTYPRLDDFYDALFDLGITNPGEAGFVKHDDGTTTVWGPETCNWFLNCNREADATVHHPVLGSVPTCAECRDNLGLTKE